MRQKHTALIRAAAFIASFVVASCALLEVDDGLLRWLARFAALFGWEGLANGLVYLHKVLWIGFLFAHTVLLLLAVIVPPKRDVAPNRRMTGYRSSVRYWVDLCWHVVTLAQLVFAPWRNILSGVSLEARVLLACALLALLVCHRMLYRRGAYRYHRVRRFAETTLRGEGGYADCPVVSIHNAGTGVYLSSLSSVPMEKDGRPICALDWEADVLAFDRRTPEGERLLAEMVQLVVYVIPIWTVQEGEAWLKDIWAELHRRGEDRPQTRLAVVFVMEEPCPVEVPQELGYVAQMTVQTVRQVEDISLKDLLSERYPVPKEGTLPSEFSVRWLIEPKSRPFWGGTAENDCRMLYECSPCILLRELDPEDTRGPRHWDPALREFFRGAVQLTPCLSSLLGLMDLADMMLRLALYTLLVRHGETQASKENVPDDFRELGKRLLEAVREDDGIFDRIKSEARPCRFRAVLQGVKQQIKAQDGGQAEETAERDSYTWQDLCGLLAYVRNKSRGHGVIQENVGLLCVFMLEAAVVLGDFLAMNRFSMRLEGEKVLAGWDGALTELGDFAFAAEGRPVLIFDAKKAKKLVAMDYFRGVKVEVDPKTQSSEDSWSIPSPVRALPQ